MKTLKGHAVTEGDYKDIEDQLNALFYELVFKPIVDLLKPHNAQVKAVAKELRNSTVRELRNAKFDPIVSGINSGKIQYVGGVFSGDFNASISRALKAYGAKWNKLTKTFAVSPSVLPTEVIDAAKNYAATARQLHDALEDRLKNIEMMLTYHIQEKPIKAGRTVKKMDEKFQKHGGKALGIEDLSDESQEKLGNDYAHNLKPYIKKFSSEQIAELRALVRKNAEQGYRFDSLIKRIQSRFDVNKTKATFLARQETALFTTQVRKTRFAEAGVTHYRWSTAGDPEVRLDHQELNGKIFAYDDPPIVDRATGRRDNPGSDFNCRCIDIALIPEDTELVNA